MKLLDLDNIPDIIEHSEKNYSERIALRFKKDGIEKKVTFRQFCYDIRYTADLLRKKGYVHKHIALVFEFRYEWLVFMYAVLLSGNCCVPINSDEDAETIQPDEVPNIDVASILNGNNSINDLLSVK